MKRTLEKELKGWKESKHCMPLLLRGARQVGKSYLVQKFGRDHFESCVVVDFEKRPEASDCFGSLEPKSILARLEILTGQPITPGKTLLFLDEIQECPRAIMALRYFKEEMPDLHVIAAGSLLEFALQEENFSFPVGRVQFLYLRPLSFHEFLQALGDDLLLKRFAALELDETVHEHALMRLRQYLLIGGMPAVVQRFIDTSSYVKCRQLQSSLLEAYRADFAKYATKAQHKYLQLFFERAPALVGHRFQFTKIAPEARSRELRTSLQQLGCTGLIHEVHATGANGLPLAAERSERKFKLLFLDVGLLQAATQISAEDVLEKEILQINSGSVAEQFVGQELLAYSDYYEDHYLYFWERVSGGSAEVDYVVPINSKIAPLEVKAGKTGRLRSLKQFMQDKECKLGIRVSQHPFNLEKKVLSVPLYLLEQLGRLYLEALGDV